MRIGELAARADMTTRAIRHYEQLGVLAAAERTENGYRDYGEDAITRLAFVRAAQSVGLTLGEIREVIAFRDRAESPCAHVVGLLERRSADLSRRITELQKLRADVEVLVARARTLDPADCSEDDVCHIVRRSEDGSGPHARAGVPAVSGVRAPEVKRVSAATSH